MTSEHAKILTVRPILNALICEEYPRRRRGEEQEEHLHRLAQVKE